MISSFRTTYIRIKLYGIKLLETLILRNSFSRIDQNKKKTEQRRTLVLWHVETIIENVGSLLGTFKTFFENLDYSLVAVNNCQPPLLFQFARFFGSHGYARHRLHSWKRPSLEFSFSNVVFSILLYFIIVKFYPKIGSFFVWTFFV